MDVINATTRKLHLSIPEMNKEIERKRMKFNPVLASRTHAKVMKAIESSIEHINRYLREE